MKQIQLTKGKVAIVDDEDYYMLSKIKWQATESLNTFYASASLPRVGGKQKTVKMHRLILGVTDPKIHCDHRDGNGLNNQKSNLRICTNGENQRNACLRTDNKTGFKGVCFYSREGRFISRISVGKRTFRLGSYLNAEDAARAYDKAAKIYHGEFARLNFPNQ